MPPTRGISCLSLVLYGIRIGSEGVRRGLIVRSCEIFEINSINDLQVAKGEDPELLSKLSNWKFSRRPSVRPRNQPGISGSSWPKRPGCPWGWSRYLPWPLLILRLEIYLMLKDVFYLSLINFHALGNHRSYLFTTRSLSFYTIFSCKYPVILSVPSWNSVTNYQQLILQIWDFDWLIFYCAEEIFFLTKATLNLNWQI